jgi:hypothetical protein
MTGWMAAKRHGEVRKVQCATCPRHGCGGKKDWADRASTSVHAGGPAELACHAMAERPVSKARTDLRTRLGRSYALSHMP